MMSLGLAMLTLAAAAPLPPSPASQAPTLQGNYQAMVLSQQGPRYVSCQTGKCIPGEPLNITVFHNLAAPGGNPGSDYFVATNASTVVRIDPNTKKIKQVIPLQGDLSIKGMAPLAGYDNPIIEAEFYIGESEYFGFISFQNDGTLTYEVKDAECLDMISYNTLKFGMVKGQILASYIGEGIVYVYDWTNKKPLTSINMNPPPWLIAAHFRSDPSSNNFLDVLTTTGNATTVSGINLDSYNISRIFDYPFFDGLDLAKGEFAEYNGLATTFSEPVNGQPQQILEGSVTNSSHMAISAALPLGEYFGLYFTNRTYPGVISRGEHHMRQEPPRPRHPLER